MGESGFLDDWGRREFATSLIAALTSGPAIGVSSARTATANYRLKLPPDYQEKIEPGADRVEELADALEVEQLDSGDGIRRMLEPGNLGPEDFQKQDRGKLAKNWLSATEYEENSFRGDCEDYASFVQSLLEASGKPSVVVIAEMEKQSGTELHAYVETVDRGERLVTDHNDPLKLHTHEGLEAKLGAELEPVGMFTSRSDYRGYSSSWATIYRPSDGSGNELESWKHA